MKTYYMSSGSFANGMIVRAFSSKAKRDAVVNNAPDNSMMHSHYDHSPEAITAKRAQRIMAGNRIAAKLHKQNSAFDANYGTTEIDEIE